MNNLFINVVINQKSNEVNEIYVKNKNSIESSKLKEPIILGKCSNNKRQYF